MKAKEIIELSKYMILPELIASYDEIEEIVCKESKVIFDHVKLEC